MGGDPIPGPDEGGYPLSRTEWGTSHPGLDGITLSRTGWGTPPIWDWMGYHPPSGTGWGTPSPVRRQSSIASTCYAAVGMPLAFPQDFLVRNIFLTRSSCGKPQEVYRLRCNLSKHNLGRGGYPILTWPGGTTSCPGGGRVGVVPHPVLEYLFLERTWTRGYVRWRRGTTLWTDR